MRAVWMLGNLARGTYVGSSDFIWPYSYNKCNSEFRTAQEINACSLVNHFGLEKFQGRGAPEIDIIESMQGEPGPLPNTFVQRPYQSASLQLAPGIDSDRPVLGHRPHPVRVLLCLHHPSRASLTNLSLSLLRSTGTKISSMVMRRSLILTLFSTASPWSMNRNRKLTRPTLSPLICS